MKSEIKIQLDKVFQTMKANMAKVDLLSMYSHSIFSNFPQNLPDEIISDYNSDVKILTRVKENNSKTKFNLLTEKDFVELGISKEFYRFFNNVSTAQLNDKELSEFKFEQVLYGQEMISLYSYLEGYFQDLQRLLFLNDKNLLSNKDKEVSLNKILDVDNYDKLISIIIEEKLAKSGYEKISEIINKWKKEPYKIILKLKKNKLEGLDKFTAIRNIIIHNNSKIDTTLLEFLNVNKYKVGDTFELDDKVMEQFRNLVFEIIYNAYLEICMKYPEKSD